MLSHLCRAKPLWILRTKALPTAATNEHRGNPEDIINTDIQCQLIHCSYCDSRICCSENSTTEASPLEDSFCKETENPAYGLSSKLRLECDSSESLEERYRKLQEPNIMNLESIPEDGVTIQDSHRVNKEDKYTTFDKTCLDIKSGLNQLSNCCRDIKIVNNQSFSLSLLKTRTKSSESDCRRDNRRLRPVRQLNSSNVSELTDLTPVKTEDSIHEWLRRISDWVDKSNCPPKEDSGKDIECCEDGLRKDTVESPTDNESVDPAKVEIIQNIFDDLLAETSAFNVLSKASKDSPANIPMVVMQCSRLHSHLNSKPPYQQASLPMGTLVTALYQESDWLYVQTPHGVEGFVTSSNCVPIGTVRGGDQVKRPWEPCDFPIEISIKNTGDFGDIHGTFVQAQLPNTMGRHTGPFVNMVKMKTNMYSDRCFNNTFKLRESIKMAKTVRDILRNSPEIQVNE